ncbi:unnamed protein product [Triticum turgidum subsp. durum]|uniref:Uncharacterized protein n=1 Tax=Triticum turgidum subsp. durum TaxID=4567 RepID=A0A9R0XDR7_TRITD|nr:unnamed protein product [Triticum turgidum subsp. durum]
MDTVGAWPHFEGQEYMTVWPEEEYRTEIKDAVAVALKAFQELQCPADVSKAPSSTSEESAPSITSSDLSGLDDEHWIGGMDAGSYYANLAQGMLMEPPAAGGWREDREQDDGVGTSLWTY